MAYTTINKSSDYFNTHLYSGNDTTNNQQVELTPDLVWVKCRNNGVPSHYLVDKVRGDEKYISTNATTAEQTDSNTFDLVSGGFNLAGGNGWTNVTGRNYVAWNWKANGAGVSNTDGSITSTVSVDTTSGFSTVSYTGTGSNATVGHGLGVAPSMIITKSLVATQEWCVYHKSLGATKYLFLNENSGEQTGSVYWQDTTPTSSIFSIGASGPTNSTSAMIAYCFAEKQGYSKFGSYTGNGNADGPFAYTGFKPAFILIKSVSTTNWNMFDNKRSAFNVADETLWANSSDSESTVGTSYGIDILSNGFKAKTVSSQVNNNNTVHIFMAFAEAPLVGTNNIAANAR